MRGAKRSLQTDGAGVPIAVTLNGANRHDKKMVEETLNSIPVDRPKRTRRKKQGICMDKGYDHADTRQILFDFGYTPHVRSRGEEKIDLSTIPGYRARRWVVERTLAWLGKRRSIRVRRCK